MIERIQTMRSLNGVTTEGWISEVTGHTSLLMGQSWRKYFGLWFFNHRIKYFYKIEQLLLLRAK
jgi:hypothetical protein